MHLKQVKKNKETGRVYLDGRECLKCGKLITFGSKSGMCRSCSYKRPKKEHIQIECKFCGLKFKTYPSRTNKCFCSKECRVKSQVGVKMPLEAKIANSEGHKGENHWNWQGGKTRKRQKAMNRWEYRQWREKVFERDNYTCQMCGIKSGSGIRVYLQADHIKPWCLYPQLRYNIDNGRTLCLECHKNTPTYFWKVNKYLRKNDIITPETKRNSKK